MKNIFSLLFAFILISGAQTALAETVTYTIPDGTAYQLLDWNDQNNPIVAKVGDTLVIINDDSEPHQLHTLGAPCAHGDLMEPGQSWSCVLEKPYNSFADEPIKDHLNYDLKFWIIVNP